MRWIDEAIDPRLPRRLQILGVAGRMFAARGFAGTGVDEIGEAAGITGPALYRHFANKQAILDALVVEGMQRLLRSAQAVARPESDAGEWLDALIDVRLDFAFGPDRYSFIMHRNEYDNISPEAMREVAALEDVYLSDWLRVIAALRPGVATGVIRRAMHAVHVFIGYVALEDGIDPIDDVRAHIAVMARAAIFA
ncbi:TetR/AcrR family transcriptional regulator [Mycobacterium sp. NPDC003449]